MSQELQGKTAAITGAASGIGLDCARAMIEAGADVILIPEIEFNYEAVCRKILQRVESGRDFSIVVVSEGARLAGGKQVFCLHNALPSYQSNHPDT